MRILVTGATGFLGRALLQVLEVHNELELHTTDIAEAPGSTITSAGARGRAVPAPILHRCDLLDCAGVARLLAEVAPERIYHLAGTFTNQYGPDFQSNVDSTRNLLEWVRQSKRAIRVLLIGSAAEYGYIQAHDNPVREEQALAPVSIYGWSKACQTLLMGYYHQVHRLDVVMARLFNLTGAGASERLFVGRLERQIEQFLSGAIREITVGALDSVRDYLPVEQAALGVERVMRFGQTGQVYHVASGVPTRMEDLLAQLLRARGLPTECVRQAPREPDDKLDVPVIYADVQKISRLPQPGQT